VCVCVCVCVCVAALVVKGRFVACVVCVRCVRVFRVLVFSCMCVCVCQLSLVTIRGGGFDSMASSALCMSICMYEYIYTQVCSASCMSIYVCT